MRPTGYNWKGFHGSGQQPDSADYGVGHVLKQSLSILLWIPVWLRWSSKSCRVILVTVGIELSNKATGHTASSLVGTYTFSSMYVYVLHVHIVVDRTMFKSLTCSFVSLYWKVIFGGLLRISGLWASEDWVSFKEHSSHVDAAHMKVPMTALSPRSSEQQNAAAYHYDTRDPTPTSTCCNPPHTI